MTQQEYINWVAPRIVIDSLDRNLLPSPRISQACFEPEYGKSELAVNAKNLFGVKDNDQWEGKCYNKLTKECYDGVSMETVSADFQAYDSWEDSIYWQGWYLENRCTTRKYHPELLHYAELFGNRNYKDCAQILQEKNYGTSPEYAKRVIYYVEKHNLTQFDTMTREEALAMIEKEEKEVSKTLIIALDAGHGMKTSGKRCLKSLDANETREWWLNDRIMDRVEVLLADYDCKIVRVDDTTGAKDISLSARVQTANSAGADVYISAHHDAGKNGGKGGGTTVFWYSSKQERESQATSYYNILMSRTGLRGDRSQPVRKYGYYVLKNTNMPAFLVENGFMDSADDVPVILSADHANKTAQAMVDFLVKEFGLEKKGGSATVPSTPAATPTTPSTVKHEVKKGESLISIGKKYDVAWQDIAAANGINAPYHIYVGQVLKIPGAVEENVYYPAYTGKNVTLAAALTSLGITSTYAYRKKIATANGITAYIGTTAQNTQMYNLLKAGLLKKAE